MKFKLHSEFIPRGDQGTAIAELCEGIKRNNKHQCLLGVTGSGKTFTIANVIEKVQLPTLVISHNKTLAAQLYEEFKLFFPENAVEYFVSFYDYYQPEAYLPSSDTYIEKTADINQEIDRLRLKATSSLMSRRDVILVASVSCIYNLGSPDSYAESAVKLTKGQYLQRDAFFQQLVVMHYARNDMAFERGKFRIRGDTVEIFPAYEDTAVRIQTFGDEIERILIIDPLTSKTISELDSLTLFPAKHFVSSKVTLPSALALIKSEMETQVSLFEKQGKLVEAQRLKQRTLYDIEMLNETGYVNGIENYSRILDGREPGSRPYSLLDFFTKPFLLVIDESHASIPQIGGMYNGDKSRKQTLVDHGFRIPCALDNRPLMFQEFETLTDFVIYSSATPADYELKKSEGIIVEQIIRPTGLVDPPIIVKPAINQIDDLIEELRVVVERKERILVTTLTKKMAEDLTEYLQSLEFKVRYLHSEIETLRRPEILNDLREGVFDILIGINLLREGLDLPEVSLVAILDADKEGFLRSTRSLIQIAGRAARNINGKIILYADTNTQSIQKTLLECQRRREKQERFNAEHNISPQTTVRKIASSIKDPLKTEQINTNTRKKPLFDLSHLLKTYTDENDSLEQTLKKLEKEMIKAAKNLEFEKAASIRDAMSELKKQSEDV